MVISVARVTARSASLDTRTQITRFARGASLDPIHGAHRANPARNGPAKRSVHSL